MMMYNPNKDPRKICSVLEFLNKMLDNLDESENFQTTKEIIGFDEETGNRFYLVKCPNYDGLSLLKYIDCKGDLLIREGEELLELAVKIAKLNHDGDQDRAMEEVMENFSQSGVGVLRNLISLYILQGKHAFVFQCLKGIKNPDVKGDKPASFTKKEKIVFFPISFYQLKSFLVIVMMNRDPTRISSLLDFLSKMLDQEEDYQELKDTLGIETKREVFYLLNCEVLDGFSLLQYIDGQSVQLLKQRQELVDLAVKIAKLNHEGDSDKAMEEVMENFCHAGVDVLRNIVSFYIFKGKHIFAFQCLKGIKDQDVKGDHKKCPYLEF